MPLSSSDVDRRTTGERQPAVPNAGSGPPPPASSSQRAGSPQSPPSHSQPGQSQAGPRHSFSGASQRPTLSRKPSYSITSKNGSSQSLSDIYRPQPSASSIAASAAAAASAAPQNGKRPVLKVLPPEIADGAAPSEIPRESANSVSSSSHSHWHSNAQASLFSSPSVDSNGSQSSALMHSISPLSADNHSSTVGSADPLRRRLWFRKKSGGSATSLIVSASELVDDVKLRILQKYPTSLQQRCDPADLVMTVSQPSGIRLELQPDENIIEVMNRFFPKGMRMSDALEVGPSASMWSTAPTQLGANGVQNAANAAGRSQTPRSTLQRARSYSNTYTFQNQNQGQQFPATIPPVPASNGGLTPTSGSSTPTGLGPGALLQQQHHHSLHHNHGSPNNQAIPSATHAQENNASQSSSRQSNSPISEHPPSSSSSTSLPSPSITAHQLPYSTVQGASTSSSANGSAFQPDYRRMKRSTTSVLLLPRKLPAAKASDATLYGAKLVPLTGNKDADAERADRRGSVMGGIFHEEPNDHVRANEVFGNATDDSESNALASLWQLQQQHFPTLHIEQGKHSVVPQINILIVEDNPVNQKILEAFMKRKKVKYDVANNGREALEKWKVGGFHLILMDIQLPVMTGLEATKEIRRLEIINGIGAFPQAFKITKQEPAPHEVIKKSAGGFRSPVIIVALTASSDSDDKSDALAAGCNDFLTKPVNFMWLEKKIIEWGCMQALIDFDGWKKWSEDNRNTMHKSVSALPKGRRATAGLLAQDSQPKEMAPQSMALKAP